jgi:hypothetical protein
MVECENCGIEVDSEHIYHNERLGLAVCQSCDDRHPEQYDCSECGEEWSFEDDAERCCWPRCPECGEAYPEAYEAEDCCRPSGASYPRLSDIVPYQITVPVIEDRPARLCSIEQEVSKGGTAAAQMLYDYGYAVDNRIESYSWSPSRGNVGVCQDGSLPSGGGEVIYSRFDLSDRMQVQRLSGAAGRMRQLAREANVVRVNTQAGTHIHISATAENGKRLGPTEMTALHELFCYAEDAIYGLAAAGWHAHRQSPNGGGYCRPVPKIDQANAWRINRAMRSERYYGLNFGRLLQSAASCHCGAAQFGVWEECECGVFDTATVEWRVFNASTKPETLHAWILLAQAMTAHAFRHGVGTLPVNAYGDGDAESRWEVLEHLFQILPLTETEISVIRKAAKSSPLYKR